MNFREFCKLHGVSRAEQESLAWHLAQLRARALYSLLCGGYNGPKL